MRTCSTFTGSMTVVAGLLSLAPIQSGCGKPDAPGVFIELRVNDEAYRPHHVQFHWMLPGRVSAPMRLPETGDLARSGPVVGSLFFETEGPLLEPRLLAVRGYRGQDLVSGGALVIPADPSRPRVNTEVTLGPPLADSDGDGTPDIVEMDCLSIDKGAGCLPGARDGGLGDGSVGDGRSGIDGPDAPGEDAGADPDAGIAPDGGVDSAPDAASTLAQGLIAYYSFEEAGNATLVIDRTGKGNNGTRRGNVATVAGPPGLGNALEIPGQDGTGVTVADSSSIEEIRTGLTITAFTRRTADRQGLSNVVSRQAMTGASEHFSLAFSQTTDTPPGGAVLRVLLNTTLGNDGRASLVSPMPGPKDRWVHVAVTYDGATLRLYIDGMPVANQGYSAPIGNNDITGLCVGCGQTGANASIVEPLGGTLDELALYSRALTDSEIARLAAGERPPLAL